MKGDDGCKSRGVNGVEESDGTARADEGACSANGSVCGCMGGRVFDVIGGADEVTWGRVTNWGGEFGEGGFEFTNPGSMFGCSGRGCCRGRLV